MIQKYIDTVCDLLGIEPPKISYDISSFKSKTQMAQYDPTNGTIYISDTTRYTPDYMLAIAHELRHAWQVRTNPDLYLNDYKPVGSLPLEDYNNQLAELDANAFAAIIMVNLFKIKPLWHGLSQNTVNKIEELIPDVVKSINDP